MSKIGGHGDRNQRNTDTRFSTMAGLLEKNLLEKWLGVIRRGTYQSAFEDSRWEYEPVSDLRPEIDTDSNPSDDGSNDEGINTSRTRTTRNRRE